MGMTWRNGGIALSGTRTRWKFGGENSRNESLRWPLARLPYSNMGWSIGALNVAQCAGRGDKMGMHEANKQELKMERAIKGIKDKGTSLLDELQLDLQWQT